MFNIKTKRSVLSALGVCLTGLGLVMVIGDNDMYWVATMCGLCASASVFFVKE